MRTSPPPSYCWRGWRVICAKGDAAIDVLRKSATLLTSSLGVARYQELAAAHEFDCVAALEILLRPASTSR